MTAVYMNPREQERSTISHLFGHSVHTRAVREWHPVSALVYDMYEIERDTYTDFKRTLKHLQAHKDSIVVLNLTHESVSANPSPDDAICKFIDKFWQRVQPHQVGVMCSQTDSLEAVRKRYPGIETCCANFWESHTALHRQKQSLSLRSGQRFVSLNRRYTHIRALLMYSLRNLTQLEYSFGHRGYWDDAPALTVQDQELKLLQDPQLTNAIKKWQQVRGVFRELPCDITDIDEPVVWDSIYNNDISIVVESRTAKHRASAFVTEKTFRPVSLAKPVFVIGQYNIAPTLQHMGYQTLIPHSADPVQQVYATVAEVTRIANMDLPQYRNHLNNLQEVVQHNLHNFNKRTTPTERAKNCTPHLAKFFHT